MNIEDIRLPVVEGKDIRFARTSGSQGLSQVRVSDIVQGDQGFIWFGTWNGLNRYDGYNFKVFKHDPERPESLRGVYIYSLFKDRAGTLWVETDQFLDRFDPLTETFSHYRFDVPYPSGLTTTVNQLSQYWPFISIAPAACGLVLKTGWTNLIPGQAHLLFTTSAMAWGEML